MATHVKQPTCWPKLAAICCCIPLEDGTEGVPFGVLCGKKKDTLSQLLGEVSKQLPLATTTRSWTYGFRSLEAVSDDHRPLYASHLTALLVTLLLIWIMQEMLWSIRHSGAEDCEESSHSVWTHFWIKSETHTDSSFFRKDKKWKGSKSNRWTLVFLCMCACIMSELAKNILGYSQGIQ